MGITIWWTRCIILLTYNVRWPVGWCAYLKKAVDFVEYVLRSTGRSVLWICPLGVHTWVNLRFCLTVCGLSVDVMHYVFFLLMNDSH